MEIQGTKPLTISYGLVDSPIGMLAWILDKLHFIVEADYEMDEEELITWTMVVLPAVIYAINSPCIVVHYQWYIRPRQYLQKLKRKRS